MTKNCTKSKIYLIILPDDPKNLIPNLVSVGIHMYISESNSDASLLLDSEDADDTVAAIEDEQDESEDITHDITENLRDLNIISPKPSSCTLTTCLSDRDKFKLKCMKCLRLVHYACTQLPPYQIALFMQKNYMLYVCNTCVGKISVERIEELSEQIKFLINELELKTEELDNLNSKYNKIENEQSCNNQLVKSM